MRNHVHRKTTCQVLLKWTVWKREIKSDTIAYSWRKKKASIMLVSVKRQCQVIQVIMQEMSHYRRQYTKEGYVI